MRIGTALISQKDYILQLTLKDTSINWLIKRFLVICLHNFASRDTGNIAITCFGQFLHVNNFMYLNNKGKDFIKILVDPHV